MNIISNNCVGAGIYKELNTEYNNPFMWCFITGNNFYKLIKEYDTINFHNIKVYNSILDKDVRAYDNTYSINIDNKLYAHYIHYICDSNYDTPTKKSDITGEHSRDILYKDAKLLCINNYNKRLARMNEEPLFIVTQSKYSSWDDIRNCMYLKSKYKRIFLIPQKFIYDYNNVDKNCEIIIQPESGCKWVNEKAKYILSNSKILISQVAIN